MFRWKPQEVDSEASAFPKHRIPNAAQILKYVTSTGTARELEERRAGSAAKESAPDGSGGGRERK